MLTPARTAVTGTVVIIALSSVLSFASQSDVARRSEVSIPVLWPLIVDGLIIVATFAVLAVRGSVYAWTMLGSSASISIAANILDAAMPHGPMPAYIAAGVAAVPPVALVAVTHLSVHLARHTSATNHAASLSDRAASPEPVEPLAPLEHEPAEPWPAGEISAPSVAPRRWDDVLPGVPTDQPASSVAEHYEEPDTDELPVVEDVTREPRDIAEDLMRETNLSNYAIAEQVGVSEATVRRWRKALLIAGVASRP
ncbi:DUF2637 domain-containing protein [Nocardia acidivorans]|uniref:DUF2637 domain-containing protein n=1 Tax=Nocardia acidivorans TaxID=404580 RepID=UPI000A0018B9|nr:helix-turn-helix domain-containing protein [Nocardia acidivorans]